MSRRVLVLGIVFACFALILWSGHQNRFARRNAETPMRAIAAPAGVPEPKDSVGEASLLRGKPAPDFALRDLDGRRVRLSDYLGKAVLINFWATWCAPCRVEMPWFVALRRQYESQGFEILGIDDDFPADVPKVPGFAKQMGLNYPVLYGNGTTYAAYDCCDALPMSYYVDRNGVVRSVTVGLGTRADMESSIRRLLARPAAQSDTQVTASTAPQPR